MAKHGGGYVILDLRENVIDVTGLVITDEQTATIDTAYREKLPILYLGPAVNIGGDGMTRSLTGLFTFATLCPEGGGAEGEIAIAIPDTGNPESTLYNFYVDDGHLVMVPV